MCVVILRRALVVVVLVENGDPFTGGQRQLNRNPISADGAAAALLDRVRVPVRVPEQ